MDMDKMINVTLKALLDAGYNAAVHEKVWYDEFIRRTGAGVDFPSSDSYWEAMSQTSDVGRRARAAEIAEKEFTAAARRRRGPGLGGPRAQGTVGSRP